MEVRARTIAAFQQQFGVEPDFVARAPGRVNLLGEHVDYNDGFVLPAAIDRATYVAFRASGTSRTSIRALDLGEEIYFDPQSIAEKKTADGIPLPIWGLYPAGISWILNTEGLEAPGMEAIFASDVPRGAGLSSSASVEMAFGVAWQALGGWSLQPMQMAKLGQYAENSYVGVNCGIMDQFASACGVQDRALYLDCRSLEWQTVQLPKDVSIVIANTAVQRSLTNSAYNDRRAACEEAVRILQSLMPGIHSLRDVSVEAFNRHADRLPETVEKRARHIVEEIERTEQAVKLLEEGSAAQFGELMNACHVSLRDLYEVSCPELDTMVAIAQSLPGCYGARLTGAGFGGCTVNLVAQKAVKTFSSDLAIGYTREIGLQPEIYICRAADGAKVEAD
ncbi:MAG: galactokinase [Chloroflexota bacterium]